MGKEKMLEVWAAVKIYLILDIAFIITSLITLHFPSWRKAKDWALMKDIDSDRFDAKYIAYHTIAFILVTLVLFPFLAIYLLLDNQAAINGYSGSIIEGIKNDETVS